MIPSLGSDSRCSASSGSNFGDSNSVPPISSGARAPAISPATWNSGMSHIITLEALSRVQNAKLMLEAKAPRSDTITPFGRPVVPEV